MQGNQTSIRLRPVLDDLYRLVERVEAFAEDHALRPADVHALTLAVEELFANTVKHSHPAATFAELTLALQDDEIAALYTDDGGPFDPTAADVPDTTLAADARAIGGLGIHFIRRTMSGFCYERVNGENRTAFVRRLGQRQ
jgi:anti-sigma regulatory factor (Ser/Thr protein kinase)